MKTMIRWIVAALVALGAIATGLADVAPAGPTSQRTFKAEGNVTAADNVPATPTKEGFTVGPPVLNTTGNPEEAFNDDESLSIRVDVNTQYYYYDLAKARYKQGTYEQVVIAGEYIRVNGRITELQGAFDVLAVRVYLPPKNTTPPPPNPLPKTTKDYTLNRHFAAFGAPTQEGTKVVIYSDYLGFVLGDITYTNNDHVQAIADHHFNKLPIVAIDGVTKFRVQREDDPSTAVDESTRYRDGTKEETIVRGESVWVAGRYMWDRNDWRFFANYVWKPTKRASSTAGQLVFNAHVGVSDPGTVDGNNEWTGRDYAGNTAGGDGNIDPGPLEITDTSWSYDISTNVWHYVGSWKATQRSGAGTLSGTISGTWSRSDGKLTGSMIIDTGTGRFAGITGFGRITTGAALGGLVPNQPPDTLDGHWQFTLFRS